MQKIKAIAAFFILFLIGCTPAIDEGNSAEITPFRDSVSESHSAKPNPIPQKSLETCTNSAETPFEIGVLPQEDGSIEVHAYIMPPNATASITLISDDPPDSLQQTAIADADGQFKLIFTPQKYDYVRWNIFVESDDATHCQYVIVSGSEWLEQGYQGPEAQQNASEALEQDIALAAESSGIDPEFLRRSSALEDEVTKLNAIIKRNESDTYAGLRLDLYDGFRVIFSFTENGSATLAKYVDDAHPLADYVVVEGSSYTEEQLLADQMALNGLLDSAEFPWSSAAMTSQGFVELAVPAPEVWEAFLAEHPIDLPPSVVVVFAHDSMPSSDPPANITIAADVYMAQLKFPDMAFMQALNNNSLTLEDGCLFAGSGAERTLIVWQPGYFPVEQDGNVVIVDRDDNQVAAVGEMLYMGGGFIDTARDGELLASVPEICQTEGSFRMGSFLPEEYRD